jgi:hypothetical protein
MALSVFVSTVFNAANFGVPWIEYSSDSSSGASAVGGASAVIMPTATGSGTHWQLHVERHSRVCCGYYWHRGCWQVERGTL